MDYRFSPEEEAFRTEVRAFLDREVPPAWPAEYGGQGMGYMKQVVLSEEIAYRRAPNTSLIGVTYAGPTVIVYGNDEQKKQFLPGITSGEIVWCQGYSEPNAVSDLASLQTRAVK